MKKLICITLVMLLFISLLAVFIYNNDNPNHGVWRAVKGEMLGVSIDIEKFFGEGFSIELKANGKCTINIGEKKANASWTLDKGIIEINGGGINSKGSLENGRLTLKYVLGTSITIVFEK